MAMTYSPLHGFVLAWWIDLLLSFGCGLAFGLAVRPLARQWLDERRQR
jgi:hypothetical protein